MFFLPPTKKVKASDFRGGYRYSKIGRKVQRLDDLKSYQKKALYKELEELGTNDTNLSSFESEAIIRKFIKDPKDKITKKKARGLVDDMEEITGYKNLKWNSRLAKKELQKEEGNSQEKEKDDKKSSKSIWYQMLFPWSKKNKNSDNKNSSKQ